MKHSHHIAGFTLLETLTVLVIMVILLTIGSYWYSGAQNDAILRTTGDSLISALEKARINAMTGKNGIGAGVQLSSTTYTTFSGNSNNPADPGNMLYTLDSSLSLSNSLSSSTLTILFSRVTGAISSTATVTLSRIANPSSKKVVVIEASGDVNVIQ